MTSAAAQAPPSECPISTRPLPLPLPPPCTLLLLPLPLVASPPLAQALLLAPPVLASPLAAFPDSPCSSASMTARPRRPLHSRVYAEDRFTLRVAGFRLIQVISQGRLCVFSSSRLGCMISPPNLHACTRVTLVPVSQMKQLILHYWRHLSENQQCGCRLTAL